MKQTENIIVRRTDYYIESNYLDCGWNLHINNVRDLAHGQRLLQECRLTSKNCKFRLIKYTSITKDEVLDV